jgi:hypothetical protein
MILFTSQLWFFVACTGQESLSPSADDVAEVPSSLPAELIGQSWQARMVDADVRQPFESNPGWGAYFKRDLPQAVSLMGDDAIGVARVHADYAAFYRQSLLLYAHSTSHVYGERLRDTDPLAVPYFRGVSSWFLGEQDAAARDLAAVPDTVGEDIVRRVEAWTVLRDAGWPLEPSPGVFPGELPSVQVGTIPPVGALPHYALAEQSEEQLLVEMADPMVLYALSRWHEAAALQAAGSDGAMVHLMLDPWRLPVESIELSEPGSSADGWLFLSFYTSTSDMAFLSASASQGLGALSAWSDRSLLAAALAPAVVDGKVAPQLVLDRAAPLKAALKSEMAERAGLVESYHSLFASLAELSVIRAGMVLADANEQHRDAGILRLNALDLSDGSIWDPVFLISVAAWSAGNQDTVRAEQLVQKLINRYPVVEAARYPLDALHIRRSRNSMQIAPAH